MNFSFKPLRATGVPPARYYAAVLGCLWLCSARAAAAVPAVEEALADPPSQQPGPTTMEEQKREGGPNPCQLEVREDDEFVDLARVGLFEALCNSARWVDSFFGEESYRQHARRTHGRFGLRTLADESEGLEGKITFRANFELPNVERRLNVFLGREHENRIFDGFDTEFPLFPEFRHSQSDRQWLLGASYDLFGGASKGVDVDTGVEVRSPLEPYVRTSYRYYRLVGDSYLARARQSVFWQNQRGFGATTSVDLERDLGGRHLVRFSNRVSIDESTEGAAWRSSVSFFQTISEDRAIAYLIGIDGATDSPVPVHEPGLRLTYRQRMLRQWFFGEVVGGVAWRKGAPGLPREESFYLGVGFEMVFRAPTQPVTVPR